MDQEQEQVIQMIQQALQNGEDPAAILQSLVEDGGMDQEQAKELIVAVAQEMQGGQGGQPQGQQQGPQDGSGQQGGGQEEGVTLEQAVQVIQELGLSAEQVVTMISLIQNTSPAVQDQILEMVKQGGQQQAQGQQQ